MIVGQVLGEVPGSTAFHSVCESTHSSLVPNGTSCLFPNVKREKFDDLIS